MPILNRIAAFEADMMAWRRDLHLHPELAFAEHRTSAVIQDKLRAFGVDEVITGLAGTGVVGVIRGQGPESRKDGRAIGLRADMDALPILEQTGLPYASENPGVMHACGHDGHTASLLGAARLLRDDPDWAGTVHFVFQPAEEGYAGAQAMLEDGLLQRFPMERIFGYHNWPGLEVGTVMLHDGPAMAAAANF